MLTKLVSAKGSSDDIAIRSYRASGMVICGVCSKILSEHPMISNCLDWEGNPFLHLDCNGNVIKL